MRNKIIILFGIIITGLSLAGCNNIVAEEADNNISVEAIALKEKSDEQEQFVFSSFSKDFPDALTPEDIIVGVYMGESIQYLHLWAEDNRYFLFLPASAKQIAFVNLDEKVKIKIGENDISSETLILDKESWLIQENNLVFSTDEKYIEGSFSVMISENIPAMFINTDVNQTDLDAIKGVEYPGSMELVKTDGAVDYSGALDYIRTRGNTTFTEYEKKPYQIKTPKKTSILGMNKAKKWILLAGEFDNTYIWNHVVYDFARNYTSTAAADGEFVDLFINGAYRGNYYLCQKIDVNTGLVELDDLEELNENMSQSDEPQFWYDDTQQAMGIINKESPADITGGYLLEVSPFYQVELDSSPYFWLNEDDKVMTVKYPENATLEEVLYIKNLVSEINVAIQEPSGINPETEKHYSEYIDVESFVNKYMLDTVFANGDSVCSVFFSKNSDVNDPKLYASPIWDYDKAYPLSSSLERWDTYNASYFCTLLINREEFRASCFEAYENVYKPYIKYVFPKDLKELIEKIGSSLRMNNARWNSPKLHNSWDSFMDTIIDRCNRRLEAVEAYTFGIGNKHKVLLKGETKETVYYFLVEDGETLDEIPAPFSYIGFFGWWERTDTGEILTSETRIYEDVEYAVKNIGLDSLIISDDEVTKDYESSLIPEQLEYIARYIEERQDSKK